MNRDAMFDILGLGCSTVDDLLYVDEYPPADAKAQVWRRERQCGGLTATALVAAARLGARCAYASVLGEDELSRFVLAQLAGEGIDVAHTLRVADACPVHSTIVVDQRRQTRTIFFDTSGFALAHPAWPDLALVPRARVLFVDHFGARGMIAACRVAAEQGIPVVADFERNDVPGFDELLSLVDHLIVSQAFAARLTGQSDPATAALALWGPGRHAVVVTAGEAGSWCVGHEGDPREANPPARAWHQRAYRVQAVDTTGCGDVFHGAYAAALVGGHTLADRVRTAAAAAALKALRPGGQAGIPTRAAVEAFLGEQEG